MCLGQQVTGSSSNHLKNSRMFGSVTHPIVAEWALYTVQIKTASQSALGTSVHIYAARVPPQTCCLVSCWQGSSEGQEPAPGNIRHKDFIKCRSDQSMPESTAAHGIFSVLHPFTSVLSAGMAWDGLLFHQVAGISDSSVLSLPQFFYKSLKLRRNLFFHATLGKCSKSCQDKKRNIQKYFLYVSLNEWETEEAQRAFWWLRYSIGRWKKDTPHPFQQVQILLCLFIACQTGTVNTKGTVHTGVSLYHPSSVQMVKY